MRLVLEKRPEHSARMALLSPVIALCLTVIVGGVIFALRGLNPFEALYIYFVEPLTDPWAREQLIAKAAPLVLIGAGLAICYAANVWNIGAEGQFIVGALLAGMIPVYFTSWQTPEVMVVMLALGILGGMAWAAVPAFLKNRFGTNEILTSLMLVYVAQYLFDWLVRGPWRDPQGFNFPKSVNFDGWQLLPRWGDVHLGALFALIAALILFVMMARMLKGFELQVLGAHRAPGASPASRAPGP
jgi:general nucleoside transport system permease protein